MLQDSRYLLKLATGLLAAQVPQEITIDLLHLPSEETTEASDNQCYY